MTLVIDLQITVQNRNLHVCPLPLCPHPDMVTIDILELQLLGRRSDTIEIMTRHHTSRPYVLRSIIFKMSLDLFLTKCGAVK